MINEEIVIIVDMSCAERDKVLEYAGPSLTSDSGDMLVEVEMPVDAMPFPERYRDELEARIEKGLSKILVIGG